MEKAIARIREKDKATQTIFEHTRNVTDMCRQYGRKIGLENFAVCIALTHDMGKYQNSFQKYLRAKANTDTVYEKVDHGIIGAKYIFDHLHNRDPLSKIAAEMMSMIVAYHHGGLNDFLTFQLTMPLKERLEKEESIIGLKEVKDKFFEEIISEAQLQYLLKEATKELLDKINLFKTTQIDPSIGLTMIMKYLYSCLIDADRTDAANFEDGISNNSEYLEWETLLKALESYIGSFKKGNNELIYNLRNQISERCKAFASKKGGIYTLSVPTGGGKTLASLRYALTHANTYKDTKKRIFYIIPYITIIEQNADEIRKAIKNKTFVLEHHSNIEIDKNYDINEKLAENWDAQIVLTSMVQFLNTFYNKSTKNTRRLHNLAESIIIIDEIQSVPVHCINLLNAALNFLAYACNTTVLLCTATQPTLDKTNRPLLKSAESEIILNVEDIYKSFRRVDIKYIHNVFNSNELADFAMDILEKNSSVLIILNTKKSVERVYKSLLKYSNESINIIYLTTYMCPAHRTEVIDTFRKLLKEKQKVICVSTQLIEAGVDISADCVIRSMAGLDSIAQASGRCNRHGESVIKDCYIVNIADSDEDVSRLPDIRDAQVVGLNVINSFNKNPEQYDYSLLSPMSISKYFDLFYRDKQKYMDFRVEKYRTSIYKMLSMNKSIRKDYISKYGNNAYEYTLAQSIRTAGEEFFVIDKNQSTIIVPYKKGKDIINCMNSGNLEFSEARILLREAQKYSVALYAHDIATIREGGIYELSNGLAYALNPMFYDDETGVCAEGGVMEFCGV